MQADLMTKGYIVTMNEAGKVSVEAWDAAAEGAERNADACGTRLVKLQQALKAWICMSLRTELLSQIYTGAKDS